MDPDIKIMHVVGIGKLKSLSAVTIHLSSDYNRKLPDHKICPIMNVNTQAQTHTKSRANKIDDYTATRESEESDPVDVIWKQRLSQNPRLFNATKFRIHNVSSSTSEDENVDMYLGITDYKEYLGTNWAPNVKELQQKGIECYNNSQAFLSDALGVGASVITKDNLLILLRRSEHCAEAPTLWDIPGGHAEPKKVIGDVSLRDIDMSSMESSAVLHEVFDSIMQEVTDEVNIPLDQLSEPLYMGTHRNTTSGGRPSIAFIISCSLSSKDVRQLYNKGSQQEADESTNIMFVPVSDIAVLDTQRRDLWEKLAPSAKGNLTCYSISHGLKKF